MTHAAQQFKVYDIYVRETGEVLWENVTWEIVERVTENDLENFFDVIEYNIKLN